MRGVLTDYSLPQDNDIQMISINSTPSTFPITLIRDETVEGPETITINVMNDSIPFRIISTDVLVITIDDGMDSKTITA